MSEVRKHSKKATIGRGWVGFAVLTNLGLIGYLYYYQQPTGTVVGLPEPFVVLIAFLTLVVAANSIIGWLYLGKPDLREVFTQPKPAETTEDH
ncbi:hypothetical protein [Natrialba swarupiae]|uniref:Uncharacterized protein n=1 Tax=Natrialba swarupiae TaxID=2448032 RepID=A0A5D5AMG6_9EURY|nr:hypothetical protein [Natrialba swarupiae]TYT62115.1 hypothetical protein FYC77_10480 [Natrialba swarupiae]